MGKHIKNEIKMLHFYSTQHIKKGDGDSSQVGAMLIKK